MLNSVIFGDNYKGSDMELNGCINDTDYWEKLYNKAGVSNIDILRNKKMRKQDMVSVLEGMAKSTPSGGVLYVNYSAHGTIVPPGVQSWVPDDFKWDKPDTWLTYDELDRILMAHENRNVLVVVISDSCHSKADPRTHFRSVKNASKTRNRFLAPPDHIQKRIVSSPFKRNVLSSNQDDVLLSGCRREQTSADAYIEGSYKGAFTHSLSLSFADYIADTGPAPTYKKAVAKSRTWLSLNGYEQVPSADGDPTILDMPFFTPLSVGKSSKRRSK